jgi:hypothetical protein
LSVGCNEPGAGNVDSSIQSFSFVIALNNREFTHPFGLCGGVPQWYGASSVLYFAPRIWFVDRDLLQITQRHAPDAASANAGGIFVPFSSFTGRSFHQWGRYDIDCQPGFFVMSSLFKLMHAGCNGPGGPVSFSSFLGSLAMSPLSKLTHAGCNGPGGPASFSSFIGSLAMSPLSKLMHAGCNGPGEPAGAPQALLIQAVEAGSTVLAGYSRSCNKSASMIKPTHFNAHFTRATLTVGTATRTSNCVGDFMHWHQWDLTAITLSTLQSRGA